MKFAIILLNWNNAPDTLECLASLKKLDYPSYHIIVVDNGSTDDSAAQIQSHYPEITLVQNQENLGFAEGNNRGILEAKEVGADMYLLLNNDTIVAPNLLSELAKEAKAHPEAGVFGPTIYFYDQPATLWYAGGGVDPKTGRCFHHGCGASDQSVQVSEEKEYVCGCALAVRAKVVEKVGLLDQKFFLIWEEIDWCWRIRQAGYPCRLAPSAKVWHKVSSSFIDGNRGPMWQYYYCRNRLLFHKKHTPFPNRLKKGGALELFELAKTAMSKNNPPRLRLQAKAALLGIRDAFLGKYGKGCLDRFIHESVVKE